MHKYFFLQNHYLHHTSILGEVWEIKVLAFSDGILCQYKNVTETVKTETISVQ